jgi:hypothetical protein
MKNLRHIACTAFVTVAFCATPVMAQGLPKLPGIGGGAGGGASTANAAEVARNAYTALLSFTKAEVGLAAALGGYEELAAHQKLLEGMKTGDVAAKMDDFQTFSAIHKSANDVIGRKAAENAKLEASNKSLAAGSMVEYVKALVASKKVVGSVQGLVKNPTALGPDASTLLYVGKEMPGIVSSGVSSTSTLFKYLGASGVDLTEAKSAAKDLGV